MSRETHRLIDAVYNEAEIKFCVDMECMITDCETEDYIVLSHHQAVALRDLLNMRYANPFAAEPDDALAALGIELNGNPMAEPQAVVASVPVPIKTGGESR